MKSSFSVFFLPIHLVLSPTQMHMKPLKSVHTGNEACLGSTCTEILTEHHTRQMQTRHIHTAAGGPRTHSYLLTL